MIDFYNGNKTMDLNEVLREIIIEYLNVNMRSHSYGPCGMGAAGLWESEVQALAWAGLNAPKGDFFTVGAFQGASDIVLGLVAKYRGEGQKVISIDIMHQKAWYRNVLQRAHLKEYVVPYDISCTKYVHDKTPLALSFHDGYHSYRAVYTEFSSIRSALMKDAILLFHDSPPEEILPNKAGAPPVELVQEAKLRHAELMSTYIPETLEVEDKTAYHKTEGLQDFLIELAIAKICDETGAQLIELPTFDHKPRYDMTGGEWERTKTSPHFALRGIKL